MNFKPNRFLLHIVLIFAIITNRCVQPYEHNIDSYENLLVVQGLITNEDGPYEVLLTRTLSIDGDSAIFEEDAIVTIVDQDGNIEVLTEKSPGQYLTRPEFKASMDHEYQLMIRTIDDVEYVSDIVKLLKGPDIDSLYIEYKSAYNFEYDEELEGIEIKLDTKWGDISNENYFLKWDYVATWEIKQKWMANEVEFRNWDDIFYFDQNENRKSCWSEEQSYDIILEDLSSYNTDELTGKTILHMDETNPRPKYGYSILVKQYAINESVYKFWEFMKENNIDNGSVFDNIPYNPKSNIECNNENIKVYGYFDAAYKSVKRLSFKSPVLGIYFQDIYGSCEKQNMTIDEFLNSEYKGFTYAIFVKPELLGNPASISFTDQRFCVDCTLFSDSEVKPDFWIF